MKSFLTILFSIVTIGFLHGQARKVHVNQVMEWEFHSDSEYNNPFREVDLHVEIKNTDGEAFILPAFWAGGNVWKFRFSSPVQGNYSFITRCNDTKNKTLHKVKGSFEIVPYNGDNPLYQHGPVNVSGNGKYLEHHDGTPFFWLADSWWHGMTTRFRWPYDFKFLSGDRREKGFTVIQFAIGFPCDIVPFDQRGQNEAGDPWDEDWESINPEYFDLTDRRVNHLVEVGLMPNIVGAWGYYIKWAGVDNMRRHWQYLIARYGAYPVTWTLAGESTLAWYGDLDTRWEEEKEIFRDHWSQVASYIKENDPYQHLLTVHPGPNSGDYKPINDMELIDMIMCQSGHDGYYTFDKSVESIQTAQKLFPDRPVIHGEVCFEGMSGKSWHDVQRFLFWSNIMMGTPGFSYGVEGIWQFNTEEVLFGVSPGGNVWGNVPWEEAYKYEGSEELGLGKKFLDQFEWWKFKPAQDRLAGNGDDVGSILFSAQVEEEYLFVFMFRKPVRWRQYRINGFREGNTYPVTWFNPITGDIIRDKLQAGRDGVISLDNAPVMQDWVLVIDL